MPDSAPAPIGHNSGARPIELTLLQEQLDTNHAALVQRTSELKAAVARALAKHPDIETEEVAGLFADQVRQITAAVKTIKEAHAEEKRPYLEAGRLVDSWFKKLIDTLDDGKNKLLNAITKFQRRVEEERRRKAEEDARRRAEEAERLRIEAEQRAAMAESERDIQAAAELHGAAAKAEAQAAASQEVAQARAADLTRVRGTYGAVTSLRKKWGYRVVDITKIPVSYLMVNDAMVKAHINSRSNKDMPPAPIPGIEFVEEKKAAVR